MNVEIPGGAAIEKVCRGVGIDEDERQALTYYIGTMLMRVPHARAWSERLVPGVLEDVTEETKAVIRSFAAEGKIDSAMLSARLTEADAVREKFSKRTPAEVRRRYETPWPFESCLTAIHVMHWRVLRASGGPSRFLTSDNPVHFFEGLGLCHAECELILPLTSDVLLHCSWQPCRPLERVEAGERLVKEMNRRIASGATRFVFYHKEATWVLSAARNKPEQLNRVRWG